LKSLQVAHSLKGQRIISLEAEVVRLRMLRTDEQLRSEVDGLREQVGKKDREIDRLQKEAARFVEGERAAIVRAQQAEQRTAHFQGTLETMQRARDEAQAERDRLAEDLRKATTENEDLLKQAKAFTSEVSELLKVREAALKVFRSIPPALKVAREVRVLGAHLKEPAFIDEKKKEAVK
ncbi:MAG: hypothetical protein ACREDF_04160, partial [Thermoplasmata archaeon]